MHTSKQAGTKDHRTTDELIDHLRNSGITVADDRQKRQLLHTGYYHGYKGYRFFREYENRLPFQSYEEVYATISYDTQLKGLFYGKVMYLETALKSIVGEALIHLTDSSDIRDMYDMVIQSYQNAEPGLSESRREGLQQKKLNLQSTVSRAIQKAYQSRDPKITHFYTSTKYKGIPLWAVMEVLTLGDFAYLLSCLDFHTRDFISKQLGLDSEGDQERELLYQLVQILRDLRNAIAHNDVIYDTRFHLQDPPYVLRQCMCRHFHLETYTLRSIEDYVVLICYTLQVLDFPTGEILGFIEEFEKVQAQYRKLINPKVAAVTLDENQRKRMDLLKERMEEKERKKS